MLLVVDTLSKWSRVKDENDATATMVANFPGRTGRSLEEWLAVVRDSDHAEDPLAELKELLRTAGVATGRTLEEIAADPDRGTLAELLSLPSGGDTSYAGLVWHDNLLWMSYYSSHEAKTSIYLAKLRLDAALEPADGRRGP